MVHELVLGVEYFKQVLTGVGVNAVNHLLEGGLQVLDEHALGWGTERQAHVQGKLSDTQQLGTSHLTETTLGWGRGTEAGTCTGLAL